MHNKMKQDYNNNRAVIYLRVSSKGQEENGFSLDAQEKMCKEYAEKENLQVVKIWKGAESAWGKIERANFKEMITYVKKNSDIKHIIFDIEDRMTRNYRDKLDIDELVFGGLNITVHFARTHSIYGADASPDKKFALNIGVAVSAKLSDDISRKTTMGMTEKAEQGLYPSCAPIGYLNNRNTGKIDVDPVRGPLIKKLFELTASGEYSLPMIEEILYKDGLRERLHGGRVRKNTLYRVLHNPIYYGEFRWAKKLYPGKHIPLISKDLYERAVKALSQFQRPRVTTRNYPFSNLLHCKECGCSIVGNLAKKKYMYYRCSFAKGQHKHKGYIHEEQLDAAFAAMIDVVSIPPDIAQWLQKAVDLRLKHVEKAQTKEIAALKTELSKTEAKLEQLYSEGLEKGYSPEFVNHNERRYKSRIAELSQQIQAQQINPQAVRQKSVDVLKLLCNMGTIYRNAPLADKKPLLRHIASDYVLEDDKIWPKYREPFNIFAEGNKKCLEIKGKIPKSSKHLIWGG